MTENPIRFGVRTVCPFCGVERRVVAPRDRYERWFAGEFGSRIELAFPMLSADDREALVSGICPDCWPKESDGDEDEAP